MIESKMTTSKITKLDLTFTQSSVLNSDIVARYFDIANISSVRRNIHKS